MSSLGFFDCCVSYREAQGGHFCVSAFKSFGENMKKERKEKEKKHGAGDTRGRRQSHIPEF